MRGDERMVLAPESLGPTVTLGEILVEIVATTKGNGFLQAQPLLGPFPSGAPAIFIDQCARMGGSAAMIGAVGRDDFGALNLARLRESGVDVSAVAEHPRLPTGSAFVRYREDGARDFVYNISTSAAAGFGLSAEVKALLARAGHLHVMGTALTLPAVAEVLAYALPLLKARGATLSVDPNLRKELVLAPELEALFATLVAQADLLLPSGAELERAAGTETEPVAALFAMGVQEIALKRGADGARVYCRDGSVIDGPAFTVEELDPTGAGDCFGGAYVAARRLGMGVAEALKYGSAAGARNVTALGPMEGAGTRAELDAFIGEQSCA